jgi:DNA-binding GntR family transcriptional regulator
MKIDDGRYQQVVDEHTMILDAILAHDAQKARDAMLQHMVRIKKNRLVEAGVESLD